MGLWLFTTKPDIPDYEYGVSGDHHILYGGPSRYAGLGIFISPYEEMSTDIIHAKHNLNDLDHL